MDFRETSTFRTVFPEEPPRPQCDLTSRQVWPAEQRPYFAGPPILNTKIPKPKGELSRLKRGGYSLKQTLGWDDDHYRKVKVSPACSLFLVLCSAVLEVRFRSSSHEPSEYAIRQAGQRRY